MALGTPQEFMVRGANLEPSSFNEIRPVPPILGKITQKTRAWDFFSATEPQLRYSVLRFLTAQYGLVGPSLPSLEL